MQVQRHQALQRRSSAVRSPMRKAVHARRVLVAPLNARPLPTASRTSGWRAPLRTVLVRAKATTSTSAPAVANAPSIAASTGPANVLVLGGQGKLALKLAKGLLEAGNKVTADVDFPEQARITLEFVRKYELISKAQLGNLKLAEKDEQLPRRARVVIVENDVLGERKQDGRYVEQALARAVAADAAQVVLVTSGGSTGTGFFNFGGSSPTQPNKSLSRSEQAVAASGVPYAILRVATSEEAASEGAVKVAAGPGAAAPAAAPVSEATAAQVLNALLGLAVAPAGAPVVLEVAAAAAGTGQAVAAQVAEAVGALQDKPPLVPITGPPTPAGRREAAAPAKDDNPLSAVLGGAPLSLGTISIRRSLTPEPEKEDRPAPKAPVKPAPAPPKRVAARAPAKEEEEDEEETSLYEFV